MKKVEWKQDRPPLTDAHLAEIRKRTKNGHILDWPNVDRAVLLSEVDRLRAQVAAAKALIPEWEHYVSEDLAYLNSPRAHHTECQELPAVITVRRENLNDLRQALS